MKPSPSSTKLFCAKRSILVSNKTLPNYSLRTIKKIRIY